MAAFLVLLGLLLSAPGIRSAEGADGFRPLFDGRTLQGWETPDPSYWTIEEGAITGRITREHPCTVNQYLVWTGGDLADFELKLKSRLQGEGGINNGFQFRSRVLPDHDVCGYQMDNNLQTPWLVRLYDEFGRHTLAMRGERAAFDNEGHRTAVRLDEAAGPAWFRLEDWHEYHLTCIGPRITLRVDGRLAAEVEDHDERRQELQGALALQLHSGPPTVVQFKDIELKVLKVATHAAPVVPSEVESRRRGLLEEARAWWTLDAGGHGARPPLRHIPGWDRFELNVKATGPGARPGARVVLLDGAHFNAGSQIASSDEPRTVFLRLRDPDGAWNSVLISRRAGPDRVHFQLSGADLPGTAGPDVVFEVGTSQGLRRVSFPVSRIRPDGWHDLVARHDGRTIALFCDGRLLASEPCPEPLTSWNTPLLLGAEADGDKVRRHFRGEMEEAALWSRALTEAEIRLLSRDAAP